MKTISKITRVIFLLPLLATLFPPSLSAQEPSHVVVLLKGQRGAYQEVIAGLMESAPGLIFNFYDLDNGPEPQIRNSITSGPTPGALLTIGISATQFARRELPYLPTVFCMVFNPEHFNLSGENLTGISLQTRIGDQLEAFQKALPGLLKIGVVYNPEISSGIIAEGKAAAKELGLLLWAKKILRPEEIAQAVKELMWTVDALWIIPDTTVLSKESFQYFLQTSIDRRIPLLTFSESFVKGGALLALAPDYRGIGRQAGGLLEKILAGASPGTIPLLHPEGALVINRNTAQALNISLPPEILRQAEKIY